MCVVWCVRTDPVALFPQAAAVIRKSKSARFQPAPIARLAAQFRRDCMPHAKKKMVLQHTNRCDKRRSFIALELWIPCFRRVPEMMVKGIAGVGGISKRSRGTPAMRNRPCAASPWKIARRTHITATTRSQVAGQCHFALYYAAYWEKGQCCDPGHFRSCAESNGA